MPPLTLTAPCTACGSGFCAIQRERRGIARCLYTNTGMTEKQESRKRGATQRK